MFRTILVAIDPAHGDDAALALRMAASLLGDDGELVLFAVVGPKGSDFFPHVPEQTPDEDDDSTADKLEMLGRKYLQPDVARRILVDHGATPAQAIVEGALREQADLAVLVSHGEGGHWPLPRHTVEYVSVNAPCAALILRPEGG